MRARKLHDNFPAELNVSETSSEINVLYIAGLGHSGSTLLGDMLNQVPGFVCLGELQRVWLRGVAENQPCACREPFDQCPIWKQVFEGALAGVTRDEGGEIHSALRDEVRTLRIPVSILNGNRRFHSERAQWLAERITELYSASSDVTGAEVLVDTSKTPTYLHLLSTLKRFNLRVVHLVRDPRAVAYSYARDRRHPITSQPRLKLPFIKSAVMWAAWNAAAEVIPQKRLQRMPYMRIRYEDFVDDPRGQFEQVVNFARGKFEGSPFTGPMQVRLRPNHILSGNVVRYQTGTVDIIADLSWRSSMSRTKKFIVTGLTLPLLRKYGYPLVA
jgi:hypothetical protein